MKKAKQRKVYPHRVLFSALASLIVISFLVFSFSFEKPEGYVEVNLLKVIGNTIIVGTNCTAIVAETSPERARNIQFGIEKIIPERPTTHDTIVQILKSFNLTVEKVVIERFDGNYYYADMYIKGKNKILKLDVMPSDGIAIAVRVNAPIYINSTLLKEIGKKVC
jgi:bifunctional DNase/RNase